MIAELDDPIAKDIYLNADNNIPIGTIHAS